MVSFTPNENIILSTKQKLSDKLSNIYLLYNDTQLLRALISQYENVMNNKQYDRFALPTRIFDGDFAKSTQRTKPSYLSDSLNRHQQDAVISTLQGDTVIWGPPGTGKTQTISAAIYNHIQKGNRVLLLSHANTAIDGAFERLAEEMQESDLYRQDRMVRLGAPNEMLLQKYPMISLEKVVEIKTEEIQLLLNEHLRALKDKVDLRIFMES